MTDISHVYICKSYQGCVHKLGIVTIKLKLTDACNWEFPVYFDTENKQLWTTLLNIVRNNKQVLKLVKEQLNIAKLPISRAYKLRTVDVNRFSSITGKDGRC